MTHRMEFHFDQLEGYTLPLVIGVLSKMPAPKALQNIPQPFFGRLKATLAHDLAVTLKMMLREFCRTANLTKHASQVLLECADRSYHRAARLSTRASEAENDARNQLLDFERWACRTSRATTEEFAPSLKTATSPEAVAPRPTKRVSPLNLHFRWMSDLGFAASTELMSFQKKHRELCATYRRAQRAADGAEAAYSEERSRVSASVNFQTSMKAYIWSRVVFSMDAAQKIQSVTAAFYLRNSEQDWWSEFTTKIGHAVRYDVARGVHRIALRDPRILNAITPKEILRTNWDAAAAQILANAENEWGSPRVDPTAIKTMRQRLRKQDRETELWLDTNGGKKFPLNSYKLWRVKLELKAIEQACEETASRHVDDPRWRKASRLADSLLADWKKAPEYLNEMTWCLATRHSVPMAFRPIVSEDYTAKDWETHHKKWLAQIERYP